MSQTTAPTLPRTAARSHQLVAASQRTTLDPFEYVDWSVPIDDSAFHLPPELLPLYDALAARAEAVARVSANPTSSKAPAAK